MDNVLDFFVYIYMTTVLTSFSKKRKEYIINLFALSTADDKDLDKIPHIVVFHHGLHCLLRQ